MGRDITSGEKNDLLWPVFGHTLHYYAIKCDVNALNIGGENNSITPAGKPLFAKKCYRDDYSAQGVGFTLKWLFVHEVTHAWQWQHGRYPVWEALGLKITLGKEYKEKAYPYDLKPESSLYDFNLEQQASIVADYWLLRTLGPPARDNNNSEATERDYAKVISELRSSGSPKGHQSDPFGSSDRTDFR